MFLDEAKLAATLNHQNVAQVYEVDQADGAYFMAMEYVHGENARAILETTLRRGWTIPLELAVMIISGAAAGLHHAHERRGKNGAAAQHRPSRRVAGEHHGRLRRQREGARLRHREGRGARDQDRRRNDQGQVRLHVARAVQGQADRSAQRHLRARHRALRADDAAPGVQGQRRLRDDEADRRRRRRAAVGRRSRISARARGDRADRDGERSERALPDRPGADRGARRVRACARSSPARTRRWAGS